MECYAHPNWKVTAGKSLELLEAAIQLPWVLAVEVWKSSVDYQGNSRHKTHSLYRNKNHHRITLWVSLAGLSGDFLRAGRYSAHTVNGAWSAWTSWSQCSRDCSRGIRNRKRVCNNPEPKYGGMPCLGPSLEFQECNILPCPGKWIMMWERLGNLGAYRLCL